MRISDWSSDVCSSDLDAGDGNAKPLVVGDGGVEEGSGAFFPLVGQDLTESDTRGVVDADVDELPACPVAPAGGAAAFCAVDGDAMADTVEATELLDVDRSEEHTSELQSLMRISYAVFC